MKRLLPIAALLLLTSAHVPTVAGLDHGKPQAPPRMDPFDPFGFGVPAPQPAFIIVAGIKFRYQ